ncbi:DUF853 domain-containing protein [Legionella sp. 27cVA30]|uniref:helicase HerA-like domain-containing protein n=1 Tax=Legionella sp. 27cVA30 TaxID=2905657 RepID=UPI00209CCD05|nr:helicase HerA-like domain-containing protein [Legionella sp. 27cVA30]MCP0914510.1 DUF853 domain-containing protein [Legionella sp. 27cVA30]
MPDPFIKSIKSYAASPNTICIGGILHNDVLINAPKLNIALRSLNRHGLIAGATGTGKTKTIQMLSEQLSAQGIPVFLMDIKGDLSGLAVPGERSESILNRQKLLGLDYKPTGYPVELLAMGEQPGVKIRATLTEFGPILFAKMLGLNETQTSIISILFQYAEDNQLLLLDLSDIKQLLSYAQGEGKEKIESNYGGLAPASLKSILRAIIELEAQGGHELFGEPSFEVHDLLQTTLQGAGVISILRLMNLQDKPKLFSTFMLGLLNRVYAAFPEIGDVDKPKLVFFIDEAHLIFSHASKALLEQLQIIVKLIRSKGVGLIFCTQSPEDIPEAILSQLGLKIQHALRAFTAKDRKAIKLVAENFPSTVFYDTANLLTSLGIGQALVSALDAHGQPTPLVAAMIRAPQSRMGPLQEGELVQLVAKSHLVKKYDRRMERESAMEVLQKRKSEYNFQKDERLPGTKPAKETSTLETLSKNTLFRQIIRSFVREFTRFIMAALGLTKSGRKK